MTGDARFQRHVFICTNRRAPGDPRGSCAASGSEEVRLRFVEELKKHGLGACVRANKSGCLDACAMGPTVVVYPEQIWYRCVRPDDVAEIVEKHLVNGEPVERLRVPAEAWATLEESD
ncbi:MAG: (2Fe-2S) ferredoxin domain-containing protein [Deltaproteobacteria bacterium]|nr:(2Fe-2S) ferredoxin domain-containing protein [Deltaproteobacteria bacterium]